MSETERSTLDPLEPRLCFSTVVMPLAGTLANDPSFNSQYGLSRIDAPLAWDTSTGSTSVIVADIDTGADYAHSDLYENIWLNQGEIPFAIGGANGLVEDRDDSDSIITFSDLNQRKQDGSFVNGAFVSDLNHNGYIDGEDLVFDPRWSNGVDNDHNGYKDDIVGWDFANNDNDPYDFHGHGTHTAGTIGAMGDNGIGVTGVNWTVQIMVVKIFTDSGGGATVNVIANALRYAVDNGARVSNNSYGGASGAVGDPLYNAIAYAASKNHLFVAAAGNESINNDTSANRSYPASYPLPNIISVAASDSSDKIAAFSNYGASSVQLSAPGVNILSTVPDGFASYSGTSMAAPHVTGAAALLLSINPTLTASELKNILLSSVDPIASQQGKVSSGGRLDLGKAVAMTPLPPATPVPTGDVPEVFFDAPHSAEVIGPVPV